MLLLRIKNDTIEPFKSNQVTLAKRQNAFFNWRTKVKERIIKINALAYPIKADKIQFLNDKLESNAFTYIRN